MNTLRIKNSAVAAILSLGLMGCAAETEISGSQVAEARTGAVTKAERAEPRMEDCGDPVAMQELVVELVNEFRSEARDCGKGILPAAEPLIWDVRLENAAIGHSDDMAVENFFSHTGSDGSYPTDRMDRAGYIWLDAIENLGPDRENFEDAISFWGQSTKGHCSNLMSAKVEHLGAACVYTDSADQEFYWTLKMGSN